MATDPMTAATFITRDYFESGKPRPSGARNVGDPLYGERFDKATILGWMDDTEMVWFRMFLACRMAPDGVIEIRRTPDDH